MIKLELLRRDSGLTQKALSETARVPASTICKAERRGLRLYEHQAKRIAEALGYEGDPSDLFEEVTL